MDLDFSNPNTINAMSMALGMIGQAFAQNPQQAAMAQMGTKLAMNQQRSQLLASMLKGGTPTAGAAPTQTMTPDELKMTPFQEGGATPVPQGLAQPTVGAQQLGGLTPAQTSILGMLLGGGGQTPFGSTQRR